MIDNPHPDLGNPWPCDSALGSFLTGLAVGLSALLAGWLP